MSQSLPDYDSLPLAGGGGRKAWGLFGPNDNVGQLNLQTPDRVVAAARLIRRGKVFPLDLPVDFFQPSMYGRGAVQHVVKRHEDWFDDLLNNFYLQGASQWDGLGHIAYRPNVFFNGATASEVESGIRNGIEHWARRGIAGPAILLDVGRAKAKSGHPISPLEPYEITVEDLEEAREVAKIEYSPGDVILLRTGFLETYAALGLETRKQMESSATGRPSAGLERSESVAKYIWNTHAAAVAADNGSVEAFPQDMDHDRPFGFLHRHFIGLFGLALGEFFWVADLAADCAADGVYEMFITSAPLHVRGGIGSPSNALAIK